MNKLLAKLVVPLIIGLLLFACSSTSSNSGDNSPSGENVPDNPQVPANSGGQNPASGNGEISVQLPSSPEIPPANVIQQISFLGGGGPGDYPTCNSYCANLIGEKTITLTYFQPNQQLRIDIYYRTGDLPDGSAAYEFLTELGVQTDNNGALVIYLDRPIEYIVLDENGYLIAKPIGVFMP